MDAEQQQQPMAEELSQQQQTTPHAERRSIVPMSETMEDRRLSVNQPRSLLESPSNVDMEVAQQSMDENGMTMIKSAAVSRRSSTAAGASIAPSTEANRRTSMAASLKERPQSKAVAAVQEVELSDDTPRGSTGKLNETYSPPKYSPVAQFVTLPQSPVQDVVEATPSPATSPVAAAVETPAAAPVVAPVAVAAREDEPTPLPAVVPRRVSAAPASPTNTTTTNTAPSFNGTNRTSRRLSASIVASIPLDTLDAHGALKLIQNGDERLQWAIFKFDKKKELQLSSYGPTNLDTMKNSLADDESLYVYARVELGADKRSKFVLIKWMGEEVKPMQRARAFEESTLAQNIIKVFHVVMEANKKGDITQAGVTERLRAAAGANYDKSQNAALPVDASGVSSATNGGGDLMSPTNTGGAGTANLNDLGAYKNASKKFFQEVEKTGNVTNVKYEVNALPSKTPMSLDGRALTVGAAEAKANTVDLHTAAAKKK